MRATTTALAVILCGLATLPAGADWLVLRDGTRVETRGAWTQKGRLVVFTSGEGRLASLRSEAVDLEASRRATAEAEAARAAADRPASEPAPAASRSVRTITNADIAPGQPAPPTGGPAEDGGEAAATPEATASDLQVRDTAQSMDPMDNHLVVSGRLANVSQRTAAAIDLAVHAYGADGEVLATQSARLALPALRPGASTAFEAHFSDLFTRAMALRFAPTATFLETRSGSAAEPPAGEPEGGP